MKKRFLIFILILILFESLIVSGDLFSRRTVDGGFLHSGFSVRDLSLFVLLALISIGLLAVLLVKNFQIYLGRSLINILDKCSKRLAFIMIILVLLMYESFQDILFIHSDIAAIHYQGYRQILFDYFSLLVWIFLVSFQVLVILIITKWDLISNWIKGPSGKKWFVVAIAAAGLLVVFNRAAFGALPSPLESKFFEELNSPLIGLQVLFVVLLVAIVLFVHTSLAGKVNWISRSFSDKVIIVLLIILAFASWYSGPSKATTFTDAPRPPNYEFYPRSDALGYEISAYKLLAGDGTGRLNHVGFWHFLAGINFITGSAVQAGYILRLLLISTIPALLYSITKSISDRLSGLIVGILFIIRETNTLFLVEFITIPQIKDGMTEPFTILGIALTIALLFTWFNNPKNPTLILLAGGVFGWVILLRVEAVVYVPAIGIGLLLLMWKSRKEWLRTAMVFSIGLILIAGPWFISSVVSTGTLSSIGMGKKDLLLNSFDDYAGAEDNQASVGLNKQQLFPYNLANNLIALFYYFPSNHQPMLTLGNLPDVFLNRIDYSDMEQDSYREKYLERYARSLPYWWDDWDGKLASWSIIPMFFSIFLILVGFFQLEGRYKIFALVLVLIAFFHGFIYAFVGKSGGRFIQVVDWVPMVFYGIGISRLLGPFLNKNLGAIDDWWVAEHAEPALNLKFQKRTLIGMTFSIPLLLMVGLSFPLAEYAIPPSYTGEKLSKQMDQLSAQFPDDPMLSVWAGESDPNLEIVSGKALYPRYYKAGESLGDNPKLRYTDFLIERIEFYLVGTENIWAALPGSQAEAYFPHGSEVLILGSRAPQVRFAEGDEEENITAGEYLKVSRIYIFNKDQTDGQPVVIDCEGPDCLVP